MTGDPGAMVIAVPAALLAAAAFGTATAAQQRATHEVPVSATLSPRLLADLLRRPWWLLGLVLTVLGLGLQLLALRCGPLAVVQPLLVTGVAFAGTSAALLRGRAPDRYVLLGSLVLAGGLAGLLLIARPTAPPRPEHVDLGAAPGVLAALVVLVVGGLVLAALVRHPIRILGLGLATGVLFGVTAALMKVVVGDIGQGLAAVVSTPELYAVGVIGPVGFLLSQNTFQQGRLISPAVAVIVTVDPVVGVLAGVAWLGETLDTSAYRIAGVVASAALVLVGLVTVTLRGRLMLARGSSAEDAGTACPVRSR